MNILITVSFFATENSKNGIKDIPVIRLPKKNPAAPFSF
jgi:hypothetical protein